MHARRSFSATAAVLALCLYSTAAQPGAKHLCSTMKEYNYRMDEVTNYCCKGFGQEDNCAHGYPDVCDDMCATAYIPFWDDCKDFIKSNPAAYTTSVRGAFEGVYAMCTLTAADNKVHDTDPIEPGDQFDPKAPLEASVRCHGQKLDTAQQLSDNTGPMDGLWMIGVTGDDKCLYTPAGKSNPSACQVMKNKKLLMDSLEKQFGDCLLGANAHPPGMAGDGKRRTQAGRDIDNGFPVTMICDYSLDTNHDGKVGNGDDLWHGKLFGAVMSKDAVYFMVTNNVTAPLVQYAECDGTRLLSPRQ